MITRRFIRWFSPLAAGLALASIAPAESRIQTFEIESEYQPSGAKVRVLAPEKLDPAKKYPVLYILPAMPDKPNPYGDGLAEAEKLGLADAMGAICVSPDFPQTPWYADHPEDKGIRQESHLLKAVIPFVDGKFPTDATPAGRLLIGFSKSGFAAYSLLLRHLDTFGGAAAFDSPFLLMLPDKYGSGEIFGTLANFEEYRVDQLFRKKVGDVKRAKNPPKFALLGYKSFLLDGRYIHETMKAMGIPHHYSEEKERPHHWNSGWLEEAAKAVMGKE
jgi:hypothetical protein